MMIDRRPRRGKNNGRSVIERPLVVNHHSEATDYFGGFFFSRLLIR